MKKYLLPIRPVPQKGESPGSYILRATEENVWKSPIALIAGYSDGRVNPNTSILSIFVNKSKWNEVLHNLQLDTKRLKMDAYYYSGPTNSNVIFNGMKIPYSQLSLKNPKVCVKCLRSYNYLPAIWDHSLIGVCTKHKQTLTYHCSACEKKLSWNRPGIGICKCGSEIEDKGKHCLDTTGTLEIVKLIEKKDSSALNSIEKIYRLTSDTLNSHDIKFKFYEGINATLDLIRTAYTDNNLIVRSTTSLYRKGVHPRVFLSKFFTSEDREAVEIAKSICQLITYSPRKFPTYSPPLKHEPITINNAAKILGTSPRTLHKSKSHIQDDESSHKNNPKRVCNLKINRVLMIASISCKSARAARSVTNLIRNRALDFNFSIFLESLLSGELITHGMKPDEGVMSTHIEYDDLHINKETNTLLTISEVAHLCDVNYENIRFLIKSGFIEKSHPIKRRSNAIYISKENAITFHEKYVFGGVLARLYNMNATNFSEKLISLGANPVSGPGIDGGLTYLFARKDIEKIEISDLLKVKKYKTKAGRPKVHSEQSNIELTVELASKLLNLEKQEIIRMIHAGVLSKERHKGRHLLIDSSSLNRVKKVIDDENFVSIQEAAKLANETELEFNYNWIEPKFLECIDISIVQYVRKSDITKVLKFKSDYMSSKDLSLELNLNRATLNNFKKMELLVPVRELKRRGRKVFYYGREEVQSLLTKLAKK